MADDPTVVASADPGMDLEAQKRAFYEKSNLEAQKRAFYDEFAGGKQSTGSFAGNLASSAVRGATMHVSDMFKGQDTLGQEALFRKQHPYWSGGAELVGGVAPWLLAGPVVGAARAIGGRALASAVENAGTRAATSRYLPYANFNAAAAPGATMRTRFNQAGLGAAKMGMIERFADPLANPSSTDNPTADALNNTFARGNRALDLGKTALDYGVGGVTGPIGGWIGNRLGNLANATAERGVRGRTVEGAGDWQLLQDLNRDRGTGNTTQEMIENIRRAAFGERILGRHGNSQIPVAAQREMATEMQRLVNSGVPEVDARRQVAAALQQRGQAVQAMGPAGANHADAWLLGTGRGGMAQPATMEEWARAAHSNVSRHNQVPAIMPELAAQAAGGDAPAIDNTLTKILNLKSDGQNRGTLVNWLRGRQSQIAPQLQSAIERMTANRQTVGEKVAGYEEAARRANQLYPKPLADLAALGPAGEHELAQTIMPIIERAQAKAGNRTTPSAHALREYSGNFLTPVEVQGQGSMQPLTRTVTTAVDEAGNPMREQLPFTKIVRDEAGNIVQRITDKYVPGTTFKELRPTGSLPDILEHRANLRNAIEREKNNTVKQALSEFHDQLNTALRAAGDRQGNAARTPFQSAMADWRAANDARALPASLEDAYGEGMRASLGATKGDSLIELEKLFNRFRVMQDGDPVKEMIRHGITDQLIMKMKTGGDFHNVAKIFSNQRAREILGEILHPRDAQVFNGLVTRAGLASHTFNRNKNSITAPVMDTAADHTSLASLAHSLFHGNVFGAFVHAGKMLQTQRSRMTDDAMAGLLSHGTHDLGRLNRALTRLEAAGRPVHQWIQDLGQTGRRVGTAAGGFVGGRQYY